MKIIAFIDGITLKLDCVSSIYNELNKIGEVLESRIYTSASRVSNNQDMVTELLRKHSLCISPEGAGDRIPSKLLVELMSWDYSGYDLVAVATEDEYAWDFVREIKKLGMQTVVMGAYGSVLAESGDRFISLDSQTEKQTVSIEELQRAVSDSIVYYKTRGAKPSPAMVYDRLQARYKSFDLYDYGYTIFEVFIKDKLPGIAFIDENGVTKLDLIDDRAELERFIYAYMAKQNNVIEDMNDLFTEIKKEYPAFATANYGYNSEYAFILSFSKLSIEGNKGVRMKQSFKLSEKVSE